MPNNNNTNPASPTLPATVRVAKAHTAWVFYGDKPGARRQVERQIREGEEFTPLSDEWALSALKRGQYHVKRGTGRAILFAKYLA